MPQPSRGNAHSLLTKHTCLYIGKMDVDSDEMIHSDRDYDVINGYNESGDNIRIFNDHTEFVTGISSALDKAVHLVYDAETKTENHNNHIEIELAMGKCRILIDYENEAQQVYVPPMIVLGESEMPDPRKDAFTGFVPPRAHSHNNTAGLLKEGKKYINRSMPSDLFVALVQSLHSSLNKNIKIQESLCDTEGRDDDDFVILGESSWMITSSINTKWKDFPSIGKLRTSGDVGLYDEFVFHLSTLITPHLAHQLSLKTSYDESISKLPYSEHDNSVGNTQSSCLYFKRIRHLSQTSTSTFITSMSSKNAQNSTIGGCPVQEQPYTDKESIRIALKEARKLPSTSPLTPYIPQSLLVHNASTGHQRSQVKRKLCKTLLLASSYYNIFDMTLSVSIETAVFATTPMALRTMPSVATFRDYLPNKTKENTSARRSNQINNNLQSSSCTKDTPQSETKNKSRFNTNLIPLVIVESSSSDDFDEDLSQNTQAVVFPPLDPQLAVTCRKTFFVSAHHCLFSRQFDNDEKKKTTMVTPMWRVDMSLHWRNADKTENMGKEERSSNMVDIYDIAYAYRMILEKLCSSSPNGTMSCPDGIMELSNIFETDMSSAKLDDSKLSRYVPRYEVELELVDPVHMLRLHDFDTTATAITILQQSWAIQDWIQQTMIIHGRCDYSFTGDSGPISAQSDIGKTLSQPNYIYNISVVD